MTAPMLDSQYVLERQLGRGGMATVYLVRDTKHQRLVALKVLHAELAATLGPARFRREITTAAQLQHPHILSVYDSGETANGQLWFTMPYVEGESLRDRLRRERQLPIDDAVRITREVASAGDELGVRYLLVGRVRWAKMRNGSRVQVSPELIDVNTATDRWAQPFDAPLTDVFQVQGDIAGKVAQALQVTLTPAAQHTLAAWRISLS